MPASLPLRNSGRLEEMIYADSVGARAVAQGVATRAGFACVREMGFDMVQGPLFAKPMPARKFTRNGPAVSLPH